MTCFLGIIDFYFTFLLVNGTVRNETDTSTGKTKYGHFQAFIIKTTFERRGHTEVTTSSGSQETVILGKERSTNKCMVKKEKNESFVLVQHYRFIESGLLIRFKNDAFDQLTRTDRWINVPFARVITKRSG